MLVDSNILIYAAQPAHAHLRQFIAEHAPVVSAVSYVEVLGYHQLDDEERQYLEAFFRLAHVLPLSQAVLDQAVTLRQQRKMSSRSHAEGYGWLETSNEVRDRELLAYDLLRKKLSGTPVKLPRIKTVDEKAAPFLRTGEETPKVGVCGYWIEHIPHMKAFKPKMCALAALPGAAPVQVYQALKKQGLDQAADTLKSDLAAIKPSLAEIAAVVGELTIAINSVTGQMFLTDVAPAPGGQVGGEELRKQAAEGIENILKKLE